jgi:hypothetical protein
MPCFCGAEDCYQCHPEHFIRNEFGRLVLVDEDVEDEVISEDFDEDIEDSKNELDDN